MDIFKLFDCGKLAMYDKTADFSSIEWINHRSFEGVKLKQILTSKDTGGSFSYHLVQIAPNCCIGEHIHNTQIETHEIVGGSGVCYMSDKKIKYEVGTLCVIPANMKHKVIANENGLYLFAKFLPALC